MSSNTHGTKNERGETIVQSNKKQEKSEEEQHLLKLLSLVSEKIRERFVNFQSCFRFLDTDHTQSISLNEFAQAMDHMRLKLSFEDIKRLFRYLDKSGNGDIGYDEFTMLLEERWRNIDPYFELSQNLERKNDPMAVQKPTLNIYDNCPTEQDMLHKLEKLAKNQVKIPLRNDEYAYERLNINRSDARNNLSQSLNMQVEGKESATTNIMANVLKHDYLRRSMEQRVQRKALYNEFRTNQKTAVANRTTRDTLASRLRSQSVLDSINSSASAKTRDLHSHAQLVRPLGLDVDEYQNLKKRLQVLQKANQRLFAESTQSDYGENPRKSKTNSTQKQRSNPLLPTIAETHKNEYREVIKYSLSNLKNDSAATTKESKLDVSKAFHTLDSAAHRTLDASARFENDDARSVMSRKDRQDAMKSIYDNKRTMSVPANKWQKPKLAQASSQQAV